MRAFLLAAACGLLSAAGCDWNADANSQPAGRSQSNSAGSVLVVNLDDVLKRTGRGVEFNSQLKAKREELTRQFTADAADAQKFFDEKKKAFGEKPTEEQQKELQNLRVQLAGAVRQAQMQANQEIAAHQKQLIANFREHVIPFTREIARQRNAGVVLARDDGVVLNYDSTVDITNEVVERMLRAEPAQTPASPSKAPEPPAGNTKTP
jgi:Skp family chaperone for outer membrane proteins